MQHLVLVAALLMVFVGGPAMTSEHLARQRAQPGAGDPALTPAQAALLSAHPRLGIDISYPQCGRDWPEPIAFGIVGVNGGRANTYNACFPAQLAWAKLALGTAGQPKAQIYVNTGNPGDLLATNPDQVSYWPKSGVNRYGVCAGGNDLACAYEYGRTMAERDLERIRLADPFTLYHLWLDVETMNSWSDRTELNRAALEGMAEWFKLSGSPVGIYSTSKQFGEIAGPVEPGTPLAGLDSWLAGAANLEDARAKCAEAPLTPGGRVTLVQLVVDDLDFNLACHNDNQSKNK